MSATEKFLQDLNTAFSEGNDKFLLEQVTEDFCWKIVGEKTVGGKREFAEALAQMKEMPPMTIEILSIVVSGDFAVVEGIVTGRNRNNQKKDFGFCDLYELKGDENRKIRKMTSYVIDISRHKRYRETC